MGGSVVSEDIEAGSSNVEELTGKILTEGGSIDGAQYVNTIVETYDDLDPKGQTSILNGLTTALASFEGRDVPAKSSIERLVSELTAKNLEKRVSRFGLKESYEGRFAQWNIDPESYRDHIARTPILEIVTRKAKGIEQRFRPTRIRQQLYGLYKGYSDPSEYINDLKVVAGYMKAKRIHATTFFKELFESVVGIIESGAPVSDPFDPNERTPAEYRINIKSAVPQDDVNGNLRIELDEEVLKNRPASKDRGLKTVVLSEAEQERQDVLEAIKKMVTVNPQKARILEELGFIRQLGTVTEYRLPEGEELTYELADAFMKFGSVSDKMVFFLELQAQSLRGVASKYELKENWDSVSNIKVEEEPEPARSA
ncbi:hypothetical protein AWC38_SpisGene25642, partial [Stylophora pistillata]